MESGKVVGGSVFGQGDAEPRGTGQLIVTMRRMQPTSISCGDTSPQLIEVDGYGYHF